MSKTVYAWDEPTGGTWIRRVQFCLSAATPIEGQCRTDSALRRRCDDMHYGLELGIVLSGRMRRYYRNSRADLCPGQIWFTGIWEPHGWEVLEAPCATVMLLVWPPLCSTLHFDESPSFNGMAPFLALPEKRPQITGTRLADGLALGRRIQAVIEAKTDHAPLWLRLQFIEALLLSGREWKAPPAPEPVALGAVAQIDRVLQMVCDVDSRLTTAEAAKVCGLNRIAFSRLFERLMGVSFRLFVLRYRLQGAAAQLVASDDPIKAVATQWGFTDASHLHHWFKQHYRVTPDAYRQQRRGQS